MEDVRHELVLQEHDTILSTDGTGCHLVPCRFGGESCDDEACDCLGLGVVWVQPNPDLELTDEEFDQRLDALCEE